MWAPVTSANRPAAWPTRPPAAARCALASWADAVAALWQIESVDGMLPLYLAMILGRDRTYPDIALLFPPVRQQAWNRGGFAEW